MAKKVIVAYVPVLHAGYYKLLADNPSYQNLYIIGEDVLSADRSIVKDLRRLPPEVVRQSISTWNLLRTVTVANKDVLHALNDPGIHVLMPDDDFSRVVAQMFVPDARVTFSPIFLRWDRRSSNATDPVRYDREQAAEDVERRIFRLADSESARSSDLWRRVGAVIAKDGIVITSAHNHSLPTKHSSWMYGDPRNNYGKGADTDKTVFIHAEAQAIATAAKDGRSLKGCDMYVTTFPCPSCAMLIAESGIGRVYFRDGYASLDGLDTLKSRKIELIKVTGVTNASVDPMAIAYPEK